MELFRNTDIFPITNLSLSTLFFKSIMLCLVAFFLPYNNSSSTLYAAQMEQAFLSEMSTCNHNISATTIASIDTSCTDTPQIFHVAITGSNLNTCGTQTSPCRSIQHAINQASSGDIIRVAAGIHQYNRNSETCSGQVGATGVLCIYQKSLTIQGGYTVDNWSVPDPVTNVTIIDGQNEYRGLFALNLEPNSEFILTIDGFTVQNGFAAGIEARIHPDDVFAFGGGMFVENIKRLALKNMTFKSNRAAGNSTLLPYGGTGAGGGLAIRHVPTVELDQVIFEDNEAVGGDGKVRGGYAIGGGLYTSDVHLTGRYLTFINNRASAGSTTGSGQTDDGQRGNAYGAGASFQDGSDITVAYLTATDNRATGGSGEFYAGNALGGAIQAEKSLFRLTDADIKVNLAIGGDGENGGSGSGGGIDLLDTESNLDRISVINNRIKGGNGTVGQIGTGKGGGISAYWQDPAYISTLAITNSVIANNVITVGQGITMNTSGGGALLVEATNAHLNHVTLANNSLIYEDSINSANLSELLQGAAILLSEFGTRNASATIDNSIIANHQSTQAALHVRPNSTVELNTNLMVENHTDINMGEVGTVRGVDTIASTAGVNFSAPDTPEYDYHIMALSSAIDRSSNSTLTIDREQNPRRKAADLGAYEAPPFQVRIVPIADGTCISYHRIDASSSISTF